MKLKAAVRYSVFLGLFGAFMAVSAVAVPPQAPRPHITLPPVVAPDVPSEGDQAKAECKAAAIEAAKRKSALKTCFKANEDQYNSPMSPAATGAFCSKLGLDANTCLTNADAVGKAIVKFCGTSSAPSEAAVLDAIKKCKDATATVSGDCKKYADKLRTAEEDKAKAQAALDDANKRVAEAKDFITKNGCGGSRK